MNRKAITKIMLTLILVSIMSMAFVTQVVANSELPFESARAMIVFTVNLTVVV